MFRGAKKRTFRFGKKNVSFPKVETFRFADYRYWFCEKFEGHFVGVHLHGAQYYGGFNDKRYDGYLAGGGVTYGYNWILSSHWNLEALIGAGYARLWYKESPRIPCSKCHEDKTKDYWGLTKLAVSVSYIF